MTRRTFASRTSRAVAGAALAAGAFAIGMSPASASWPSVPPATVVLPGGLTDTPIGSGFQVINGSIDAREIDWYRFKAPRTGTYLMRTITSSSDLNTVMALYDTGGTRLYYNDDRAAGDVDSQFQSELVAGLIYYVGITNLQGDPTPGAYSWAVLAPK